MISETILPRELADLLNSQLGTSWITAFAPESLWQFMSQNPALSDIPKSRLLKDKVLAIKALLNSSSFWTDWHVFEKVILTFNDIVPDFGVMQTPTIVELYIGVHLANTIRREKFSSEIATYVAVIAHEYGVTKLDYPLTFAQSELSKLTPPIETEINGDLEVLSKKLENNEYTSEILK